MIQTGARLFVESLETYGVSHVFGNPGTTELPILNEIADSNLEYVLALHEDIAVGMAGGYATTRTYHSHDDPSVMPLGVANLHIAPGVAHGLGNLLDAFHAGAPILVTAGDHTLAHGTREPNLVGDLVTMTEQFTKWSARIEDVDVLPTMMRRAVRTALTPPTGPVFLGLPMDVARAETAETVEPLGGIPDAGQGDPRQVGLAAEALATADEPVLVVGDEVARSGAVAAVTRLAEAMGARTHGEFKSSQVAFPMDHDLWAGRLPRDQSRAHGLLSTDTVAFVGVVSNVPTNPLEVDLLGMETTCIQVSPCAWELGKNYRADIAVLGDPARAADAIADRVGEHVDRATVKARVATAESAENGGKSDITRSVPADSPYASAAELGAAMHRAAPDVRVVAEAPTSVGAVKSAYAFGPGDYMANRGGGLGYGLPAALGSVVAEGLRENPQDILAFLGDGSYLYYPQTLYTAARYGLDLTVVVADNRNYRILKDNTLRLFGGEDDEYDYVGMDFEPPVDFSTNAASHGATGQLVKAPDDVESEVKEALAEAGPTVLDVLIHD